MSACRRCRQSHDGAENSWTPKSDYASFFRSQEVVFDVVFMNRVLSV